MQSLWRFVALDDPRYGSKISICQHLLEEWIWVQFRIPPPLFKKPTTLGWFFLPVSPSAGAGSGPAATDAAAPDDPVPGRFPFSEPTHSPFLRRTPSRPLQHWRGFPAACSSRKPPSRWRLDSRPRYPFTMGRTSQVTAISGR